MNNVLDKMENKKGLIIVGILLLLFLFVGGTFAYWGWTTDDSQRTNIVFTIPDICMVSVDGGGEFNSSLVNVMPATCTNTNNAIVREVNVNVDFTTSDSVTTVNLWLYKDDLTGGNGNYLNTDNFRYALTTSPTSCTSNVVASGTFNSYDIDERIQLFRKVYEYEGEINITETYYLYIWLDAEETDLNTAGKSFKIVMDATCSNYEEVVTLSYDLDGGSGTFNPVSVNNGETVTVSSEVPSKTGYTFLGWSTSLGSDDVEYEPGDTITLTRSTKLYAVWGTSLLYLFDSGTDNTDITGGWTNSGWNYYDATNLSGASIGNYLSVELSNVTYGNAAIGTVNKVDLTDFDNLYITINSSGSGGVGIWVSETKAYGTYAKRWYVEPYSSVSAGVKLLDVSSLSGSYYIVVAALGSQSNMYPSIYVSRVLLTNDTISDLVLPTCSVTSNSSSATITASYSDNVGVTGYYFGTTIPNSSSTFTSMTSSASGTIAQDISATGTYYFGFKDAANNIRYCIADVINKEDSCSCGYYHEWGYCANLSIGKCSELCPYGTKLGSGYCLNN